MQTVSLWTGRNFTSYPLSTPVYGSGDLPWYRAFGYWLPHHAFTLLLLLVLVLALMAWCTQHYLAARIRARLRLVEPNQAAAGNHEGSLQHGFEFVTSSARDAGQRSAKCLANQKWFSAFSC